MSKSIPQISKYMTTTPHTAPPGLTLTEAMKLMKEHQIRHLPILDGGQLIGMLTERDIRMIESLKDVNPALVIAADAMSQEVYAVSPESTLDEVAAEMASKKYGSAVVMQNQKVVGIFTVVDALTALAELLHTRLAK